MRPVLLYVIHPKAYVVVRVTLVGKGLKMPVKRLKSKLGLGRFKPRRQSITQHDLRKLENKIMSKISEYVERQKAFNARQSAAIDGIVSDVKSLKDKITELQNSAGEVTPEDQGLLNESESLAQSVTDKVEALDAETPPVPPA